jgi:L-cysteine desulfidase
LAASLALLFTLGAYNIWKPTPVIQQLNTISENEAIVAAAFDQTREALFMLSSNMKKGEEQMIHLTKFNQAQQRINTEKP